MKTERIKRHTTDEEIKFLNGLGKHSEVKTSKKDLLIGYLKGAAKRNAWDEIDNREVIHHAGVLLNKA